jgi:hypothetical protein
VGIGSLVVGGLLCLRVWKLGRMKLLLPSRSCLRVIPRMKYGNVGVRGCGRKLRRSVGRDGGCGDFATSLAA